MTDGVHIRLMVTRGVKRSPYQDPRLTIGGATIVIIPEWKRPRPEMFARGVTLFTVHIRRTGPAEQDQKLNSHSKLNCILACIQAMEAGADEALMLDDRGFVATCNSTHFFIVRKGEVWTSAGGYCLGGITRGRGAAGGAPARACRRSRRIFRCSTSTARTRPSPPARSRALFRSPRSTGGRSAIPADAARRPLRPGDPPPPGRGQGARGGRGPGEGRVSDEPVVRIAMWSGPRNISTAMMRAFGARSDCAVTRRALLRRLSRRHRTCPSDARRGRRLAADRLAHGRGGARRSAAGGQTGLVPEAHDPPHAARIRSGVDGPPRRTRSSFAPPRPSSRPTRSSATTSPWKRSGCRLRRSSSTARPTGSAARRR